MWTGACPRTVRQSVSPNAASLTSEECNNVVSKNEVHNAVPERQRRRGAGQFNFEAEAVAVRLGDLRAGENWLEKRNRWKPPGPPVR